MHFSLKSALALAGLVAIGLTVPAHAGTNLVKDGDFETADPGQVNSTDFFTTGSPFDTNWVIGGTVGIDLNNQYVLAGTKSLFLNAGFGTTVDSVTQNLATVAGQSYTLSFLADADFKPAELDVTFGGTSLAAITVPDNGFAGPPPGNDALFTPYTFTVTATGAFTGLTFSSPARNTSVTLELDNISVTPAAVPEASTTASFGLLLALGLGGVLVAAKRKKISA